MQNGTRLAQIGIKINQSHRPPLAVPVNTIHHLNIKLELKEEKLKDTLQTKEVRYNYNSVVRRVF